MLSKASNSSKGVGVLGVEGLTRSLLEQCFKMFFCYIAPTRPILHLENFMEGYSNCWLTSSEKKVAPPDELLLLAVACLGAGLLEPPIADRESMAKFKLQHRLSQRYVQVI